MKDETFDSIRRTTFAALDELRLSDALEGVRALADMSADWALKSDVEETGSAYRMMLHYFRNGSPDDSRRDLFHTFLYKCYAYADRAERIYLGRTSTTLYHTTLRTLQTMQLSFPGIVGQIEENARLLAGHPPGDGRPDSRAVEHEKQHAELCRRLFDFVWTSGEWGDGEVDTARRLLLSSVREAEADLALFVSALTLSTLHGFDAAKYSCLLDLLSDSRPLVSSRAWVGFVLVTLRHDRRIRLLPHAMARLVGLGGDKDFVAQLRNLQIQLLMTLETQEIEKQLREDILPTMMKNPQLRQLKLGMDLVEEMMQGDDPNPAWRGNKELRRMEDKLKRLAELQSLGADVYMGTFSAMKQHYPFFSVPANWFTVFDSRHPEIEGSLGGLPAFLGGLLSMDILCDSDKYSFALMLASIPESQRALMQQQFAALAADGLPDLPEGTGGHDPETMRRLCLQDFYRFFRLFSKRREFVNPFTQSLILSDCASLHGLLDDDESVMQVAEFAFRHQLYGRASYFYGKLSPQAASTVEICQKTGFCHQALEDYEQALQAYRKAVLLDEDNAWTLRHMGQCAMLCGHFEEALDCWERLARMKDDDLQAEYRVGETLIHLGRYDEAFSHLYKVDYLAPDRPRTQRALAWCSLMAHKPAQAEKFYQKLLAGEPVRDDYMNAGHAAWANGDVRLALQRYAACVKAGGQEAMPPGFFDGDAAVLASYGISADDMRIMTDAANQPD